MNKKGFTLIELAISIALLSIVLLFTIRFLLIVRKDEDSIALETKLELNKSLISSYINEDIRENGGIDSLECTSDHLKCTFTLASELNRELSVSNDGLTITYKDLTNNKKLFTRKSYSNYPYTLNNNSNEFVTIVNISVSNNKKYDSNIVSILGGYTVESVTLIAKLLELNPVRYTWTNFDTINTTENTNTLYTTNNTEDGSTVYYFAGNALNNWVKFGKCTNSSYNCTVGDDLYWRIIRTNEDIEDGGIRLLYAGSGSVANQNAYIDSDTRYSGSTSYNDPIYVGYMWGSTGSLANNRTNQTIHDNTPADKLEDWYSATFNNNSDNNSKDTEGNLFDDYISKTAIYCNDRSIGRGNYNALESTFSFAPGERLNYNKKPSLACGASTDGFDNYFENTSNIADKFTSSTINSAGTTIGNGLLGDTGAALITADELVFAGGKVAVTNSSAWYSLNAASTPSSITGNNLWSTMSPSQYYYNTSTGVYISQVFCVRGEDIGYLVNMCSVHVARVLRPVISLKADVLWVSGDGSPSNPFEVKIDN